MAEQTTLLPGLSPVGGKPVHVAFDGGRLTSDAGVLLLAEIERLARCVDDPRGRQAGAPRAGRDDPLSRAPNRHRLRRPGRAQGGPGRDADRGRPPALKPGKDLAAAKALLQDPEITSASKVARRLAWQPRPSTAICCGG